MPCVDMAATGRNIQQMMDQAGKNAKDIQAACNLTTCNAVYKWLRGQNMPTIDNLVVIAGLLGAKLDDIVITVTR